MSLSSKLSSQEDDIGFWRSGTITLKNGKTHNGLVKFGNTGGTLTGLQSFKTISFKTNADAKKKKIKKDDIDFFVLHSVSGEFAKYCYIPVKKKKTILAKVLVEGKASLYKKVLTPYNAALDPSNPNTLGPSNLEYVLKEGETTASTLFMPNVTKSFKKVASDYFNDCQSVVESIQNGDVDSTDSKIIVNRYNSCF